MSTRSTPRRSRLSASDLRTPSRLKSQTRRKFGRYSEAAVVHQPVARRLVRAADRPWWRGRSRRAPGRRARHRVAVPRARDRSAARCRSSGCPRPRPPRRSHEPGSSSIGPYRLPSCAQPRESLVRCRSARASGCQQGQELRKEGENRSLAGRPELTWTTLARLARCHRASQPPSTGRTTP